MMSHEKYELCLDINDIPPLKRIPDTSKFESSFEQVVLFDSRHLVNPLSSLWCCSDTMAKFDPPGHFGGS